MYSDGWQSRPKRRLPISHLDLESDFEVRKAALQLDASIDAVRGKELGSHTNHFLAGVSFALQSPHRGPRVLNALRSNFIRNTVAEKIREAVLSSIADAGDPPKEEAPTFEEAEEEWDKTEESECCDNGGGCCQGQVDTDNFCAKCGSEL